MEQTLVKCRQHVAILQLTPTSVAVYDFITSNVQVLSSTLPVSGIDVWESQALLWSETKAELFRVSQTENCLVATIPSIRCNYFALHQTYVFKTQGLTVEVFDLEGNLKHKLELSEPQGPAVALDVCLDFLVVGSENGFIQMWKIEDRFNDSWLPGFGWKIPSEIRCECKIELLMCNYNGTKVSFLVMIGEEENQEFKLCIYDTTFDKFSQHLFRLEGKLLVSIAWDSEEFQQLACGFSSRDTHEKSILSEIVTYFVDPDLRLIKLDQVQIDSAKASLIGKRNPYVFLYEGFSGEESSSPVVKKIPMGILAGMEKLDGKARRDILNFSYAALMGHDTEATELLESIKDDTTIKKIVRFCMSHSLHTFAAQCFANMGRAYAVSAINIAKEQSLTDIAHNKEIMAAAVAIQLGRVADAEKEFLDCKRFDLLIDLYQAGDVASVVRLHCFLGDLEAAENIVSETSDPSAIFHLGQQYEKLGNIARAMQLFAKAKRSDCAASLAMKHGIDKELLSLALQGTKKTMLSSAKHFEEKGCCEEAVLLYQRGGDIEKAVDVCVHFQLFDALRAIADNLNEDTDPAILIRCGDFLLSHKQYEKAILLLIAAGQHYRAFELCTREDVQITDKMMELFSKQISEENQENSKQLLAALAEFCDSQGSYHLACRTYTQAGDKFKAMKALMKSGDTNKVLMYANVSRQKQLYVLAASYLQTLNWHHDADIMKKIVQMYTKAGEMELLASFYEACAQVEIDGFRDYEKALGAMKEAWKFLSKVECPRGNEKLLSLKIRIQEVERFVQARRLAKSNPNGMIAACTTLLTESSLQNRNRQAALRVGDLYALLIEYYYKEGNMKLAFQTLNTMGTCKLPLAAYVDQNIINSIYEANGIDPVNEMGSIDQAFNIQSTTALMS